MRALTLVRLASPRYRALNVPPFVVGAVAAGAGIALYLPLGLVAIALWSLAEELVNKRTDRAEDAVNYPLRGELYDRVGDRAIRDWMVAAIGAYFVTLCAMWLLAGAPARVLLLWVILFIYSIGYSLGNRRRERPATGAGSWRRRNVAVRAFDLVAIASLLVLRAPAVAYLVLLCVRAIPSLVFGPRIKERRYDSLVIIAFAFPLFFLVGARYSDVAFAGPVAITAALLLLGGLGAFAKDATDLEGDQSIGHETAYLTMSTGGKRSFRAHLVISLPYLLTLSLMLAGVVGTRYLVVFLAAPVGLVFSRVLLRASTKAEREVVRELGHLNQVAVMSVALWCYFPEPLTPVVCAGALVWYVVSTRWLHSEPGLMTTERIRLAATLAGPRPQRRNPVPAR